jgi:Tetratricopeptide repeat
VSAPDHLTAVARNAHALATRGDLSGARAMLDQALEPAATMLGPDHPEVLAATRLLASLHRDLGELSDARRVLEEALAAGQFTLGDDNPALLPLSYDLAMLADELGNRHEARRNFTRLLRYGPAALGPEHEYVRAARRYLGVAAQPPPGPVPPPAEPPPVDPTRLPPEPPQPVHPRFGPPPIYRPGGDSAPRQPVPQPAPPPPVQPPPYPVQTSGLPTVARSAPVWSPREIEPPYDEHRHSRVPMLALVVVAAMALIGGGIAAYLVFRAPAHGPGPQASASASAINLPPPGDLRLRDDGSSITLTWTDPSRGTVPFIVAGGRAENALNPLGSVESGKTTYTLHGISPTADFCFLVAAVYSPEHTVPSALVCTKRTNTSPSPRR